MSYYALNKIYGVTTSASLKVGLVLLRIVFLNTVFARRNILYIIRYN